jgi:hypothetical protein
MAGRTALAVGAAVGGIAVGALLAVVVRYDSTPSQPKYCVFGRCLAVLAAAKLPQSVSMLASLPEVLARIRLKRTG